MKQLIQNLRNGRTRVEDVPLPSARAGTVRVRTRASLVSAGTERMLVDFARRSLLGKARRRPDLVKQVLEKARREGFLSAAQAAFNRLDQPLALGYSSSGVIDAIGPGVVGLKVGQRVACAGGGYAVHAEFAVVPTNLVAPVPASVDFESAAFATLAAIGMHGFRLAAPQVGERLAVIGLGLLGLLTAQIAAAAGCQVLGIDLDSTRVRLGASLGFQTASRPRALQAGKAFTRDRGFDVVLICADSLSSDPIELAADLARDRARVVAIGAVGQNIPRRSYYQKELSFINSRSYGPGRYDASYEELGRDYPIGYVRWTEGRNLEAVVDMLAAGQLRVEPLITHRVPIGRATEAYRLIAPNSRSKAVGVLLTYPAQAASRSTRVEFRGRTSPTSEVRLGVLGAGNFAGATLLPALRKVGGIQLVGIASTGGVRARGAARRFGFDYASSSDQEILKDKTVNTVAVLTRHDSHAALVLAALSAGKHVFVEKPLALTDASLSSVVRKLQGTKGRLLMVGFNRRFSPLGQLLAAFLQDRSEPLHAHYRINAGQLSLDHWTQDPELGGRLIGEACHFLDLITFLVGMVPDSVHAVALPDGGKYSEDNASMTFSFPDGSVGVVDYLANGDRSFGKERLEVFCAGKVAILDDFRSLETWEAGSRKIVKARQDKGWANEWKAFAQAIREGGPPPIPYEQLIGVTRAMLRAVESLRTQKSASI